MPELHRPALPAEASDPDVEAYNSRLGLYLFAIYFSAFAGFVVLNAVVPASMDVVVWAGLNLAVVYGFGLIIGAFLLALLYASLCKTPCTEEL